MKAEETSAAYFDRIAERFNDNYAWNAAFLERKRVWEEAIGECIPALSAGALCFDMGCGDGTLSRIVAARGTNTIGVDQSAGMLALARQRSDAAGVGAQCRYVQASLPLPRTFVDQHQGSAGLVLCSSVLEYIEDFEQVLRQFAELLRPQGRLIASVPNAHSVYWAAMRAFGGVLMPRDSCTRYQRHQFYPADFVACVERIGMRAVSDKYFALPLQRVSGRLFGQYRGKRIATLWLLTAEKL